MHADSRRWIPIKIGVYRRASACIGGSYLLGGMNSQMSATAHKIHDTLFPAANCLLHKEKRMNMPILLSLLFLSSPDETPGGRERPLVRRVPSADGIQIVYETAGSREPALIFIHAKLRRIDQIVGEVDGSHPHSCRKATMGSTCEARSAGTQLAIAAIKAKADAAAIKVRASPGESSNSKAPTARVTASEAIAPIVTPARTSIAVSRPISTMTRPRLAPRAKRSPCTPW